MTLSSVFVQRDGKERTVKVSDDKIPFNIDDNWDDNDNDDDDYDYVVDDDDDVVLVDDDDVDDNVIMLEFVIWEISIWLAYSSCISARRLYFSSIWNTATSWS